MKGNMPHDPHAEFDQTVLEMIEHNPLGVVPHTPVYQDALLRLKNTHQVYASADHKGGYVSARSLVTLPVFFAQNLGDYLSGNIEGPALEPDASIFLRYVQSLPLPARLKAEAIRPLLVARKAHHRAKHGEGGHDPLLEPVHSLFLVPGSGPHPGLPGSYLHGSVMQTTGDARQGPWAVHLHDSADGAASCELPSPQAAYEKLQEVLASAPFLLSELDSLGFRSHRDGVM